MKCANPACREPRKGLRYAADAVEICLSCAEMNRNGGMITLDDFVGFSPMLQKIIGTDRQMIQEVIGQFDHLKNQDVQITRS